MPNSVTVNREVYYAQQAVSRLSGSDALAFSKQLAEEYAGRVQMIYCDPSPVNGVACRFMQRVGEPGWQGRREWQIPMTGYADRRGGGMAGYIERMRPILKNAHRMLKDDGCIYMHVDWKTSAHMRLLMDEIFGENNLVNEIIWGYSSGGTANAYFSRRHDTILLYKKGKSFFFDGSSIGVRRGTESKNHLRRNVGDDGRVFFSLRTGGKIYRYYEDEMIAPGDVWTDIPTLQKRDPERTGFETQKPLALLKRMILSSSREGDIVCDLFSGSGTAAQAALDAGRDVLVCDIDPMAVQITRRRMALTGRAFAFETGSTAAPEGWTVKAHVLGGKVIFEDFNIAGMEHLRNETMLPINNTLADMWSVGRIYNGVYYVDGCSVRTQEAPVLADSLHLSEGPGVAAMHIAGVDGKLGWFVL